MFRFITEEDQILSGMFNKMINQNGGFIMKSGHSYACFAKFSESSSNQELAESWNLDMFSDSKNQRLIKIDAVVDNAGYGLRGQIPVIWAYVTDAIGVVAKYRVKGNGNLRDGWQPDPKKITLEWSRDDEIPAHVQELIHGMALDEEEKRLKKIERDDKVIALKINPGIEDGIRTTFTGVLISTKWTSDYDPTGAPMFNLKMLVETEDGRRLYGTVPTKHEVDIEDQKGLTIQFDARIKLTDSADFAIVKRVTKLKILENA